VGRKKAVEQCKAITSADNESCQTARQNDVWITKQQSLGMCHKHSLMLSKTKRKIYSVCLACRMKRKACGGSHTHSPTITTIPLEKSVVAQLNTIDMIGRKQKDGDKRITLQQQNLPSPNRDLKM